MKPVYSPLTRIGSYTLVVIVDVVVGGFNATDDATPAARAD
jgi:hypothetical protein